MQRLKTRLKDANFDIKQLNEIVDNKDDELKVKNKRIEEKDNENKRLIILLQKERKEKDQIVKKMKQMAEEGSKPDKILNQEGYFGNIKTDMEQQKLLDEHEQENVLLWKELS